MQKESSVVRRLAIGPTGQMRNPPGIRTPNLLISLLGLVEFTTGEREFLLYKVICLLFYCTKVCHHRYKYYLTEVARCDERSWDANTNNTRVAKVMRTEDHTWTIQNSCHLQRLGKSKQKPCKHCILWIPKHNIHLTKFNDQCVNLSLWISDTSQSHWIFSKNAIIRGWLRTSNRLKKKNKRRTRPSKCLFWTSLWFSQKFSTALFEKKEKENNNRKTWRPLMHARYVESTLPCPRGLLPKFSSAGPKWFSRNIFEANTAVLSQNPKMSRCRSFMKLY